MCELFPCVPIFREGRGFRLKSVKKCACVVGLKNCIVTCEKCIY